MASRWPLSFMAIIMAVGIAGIKPTAALGQSHLRALTARQELRSQVCIAMADGQISRMERYIIFSNAKQELESGEYEAFRRSVDQLSPPPPETANQKLAAAKRAMLVARSKQKASTPTTNQKASPMASAGDLR
jgi:hypothetical protein